MDIDRGFCASLCREGMTSVVAASQKGVDDLLDSKVKPAFELIKSFVYQYKQIPSPEIILAKTGITLDPVDVPSSFFFTELLERRLYRLLKRGGEGMFELLERGKATEAFESAEAFIREARQLGHGQAVVEPFFSYGPKVLERYENIKLGKIGVVTPWAEMTEQTMGWWPADLVIIAARLGTGKTWVAILVARRAWMEGKRVLFVGTEMDTTTVNGRFVSLHYHLPYAKVRKGRLDSIQEEKFRKGIDQVKEDESWSVIGGGFDFRMESLEASIQEVKPDLVVIDGVYLLKLAAANRRERAAGIFEETKRIAKSNQVPIVVFTQLNREVSKNKILQAGADNLAETDVAGWTCDAAYALIQTDDMKADKKMGIRPMKLREGSGDEFMANWDFERMDFSQFSLSADNPFSDTDYDSIAAPAPF